MAYKNAKLERERLVKIASYELSEKNPDYSQAVEEYIGPQVLLDLPRSFFFKIDHMGGLYITIYQTVFLIFDIGPMRSGIRFRIFSSDLQKFIMGCQYDAAVSRVDIAIFREAVGINEICNKMRDITQEYISSRSKS